MDTPELPDPNDPRGARLKEQGYVDGDFYFTPEGYVVFTEQYLLRRGYCCQNGCRHCPYGFVIQKGKRR